MERPLAVGTNAAGGGLASAVLSTKQLEQVAMLKAFDRHRRGFTLVEIMIVVAIIALVASIAIPGYLRARKRSQAGRVLNDLRLIDGAVDQYALETGKQSGDPVAVVDWTNYLKKDTTLYATGQDLFGDNYSDQRVDQVPKVPRNAWFSLSDVADLEFWSPYTPF